MSLQANMTQYSVEKPFLQAQQLDVSCSWSAGLRVSQGGFWTTLYSNSKSFSFLATQGFSFLHRRKNIELRSENQVINPMTSMSLFFSHFFAVIQEEPCIIFSFSGGSCMVHGLVQWLLKVTLLPQQKKNSKT